MTVVGFDLDGTLYDACDLTRSALNVVLERQGYASISVQEYRQLFQSTDWKKFCLDCGVKEKDTQIVIEGFVALFASYDHPLLIPGAREVLVSVCQRVASENVYFITQEPRDRVRARFTRDNLMDHFHKVHNPFEGKAREIHHVASRHPNDAFVYFGDIVSDGMACARARELGAENVQFCAVGHGYAFNTSERLREFVAANTGFASMIESLDEVVRLL